MHEQELAAGLARCGKHQEMHTRCGSDSGEPPGKVQVFFRHPRVGAGFHAQYIAVQAASGIRVSAHDGRRGDLREANSRGQFAHRFGRMTMADHQQGGHAIGSGEQAFLTLDIAQLVADRLRAERVSGPGDGFDGGGHRRRHVEVDRLGADVGGGIQRAGAMVQPHGLGWSRRVLGQAQMPGGVIPAGQFDQARRHLLRQAPCIQKRARRLAVAVQL